MNSKSPKSTASYFRGSSKTDASTSSKSSPQSSAASSAKSNKSLVTSPTSSNNSSTKSSPFNMLSKLLVSSSNSLSPQKNKEKPMTTFEGEQIQLVESYDDEQGTEEVDTDEEKSPEGPPAPYVPEVGKMERKSSKAHVMNRSFSAPRNVPLSVDTSDAGTAPAPANKAPVDRKASRLARLDSFNMELREQQLMQKRLDERVQRSTTLSSGGSYDFTSKQGAGAAATATAGAAGSNGASASAANGLSRKKSVTMMASEESPKGEGGAYMNKGRKLSRMLSEVSMSSLLNDDDDSEEEAKPVRTMVKGRPSFMASNGASQYELPHLKSFKDFPEEGEEEDEDDDCNIESHGLQALGHFVEARRTPPPATLAAMTASLSLNTATTTTTTSASAGHSSPAKSPRPSSPHALANRPLPSLPDLAATAAMAVALESRPLPPVPGPATAAAPTFVPASPRAPFTAAPVLSQPAYVSAAALPEEGQESPLTPGNLGSPKEENVPSIIANLRASALSRQQSARDNLMQLKSSTSFNGSAVVVSPSAAPPAGGSSLMTPSRSGDLTRKFSSGSTDVSTNGSTSVLASPYPRADELSKGGSFGHEGYQAHKLAALQAAQAQSQATLQAHYMTAASSYEQSAVVVQLQQQQHQAHSYADVSLAAAGDKNRERTSSGHDSLNIPMGASPNKGVVAAREFIQLPASGQSTPVRRRSGSFTADPQQQQQLSGSPSLNSDGSQRRHSGTYEAVRPPTSQSNESANTVAARRLSGNFHPVLRSPQPPGTAQPSAAAQLFPAQLSRENSATDLTSGLSRLSPQVTALRQEQIDKALAMTRTASQTSLTRTTSQQSMGEPIPGVQPRHQQENPMHVGSPYKANDTPMIGDPSSLQLRATQSFAGVSTVTPTRPVNHAASFNDLPPRNTPAAAATAVTTVTATAGPVSPRNQAAAPAMMPGGNSLTPLHLRAAVNPNVATAASQMQQQQKDAPLQMRGSGSTDNLSGSSNSLLSLNASKNGSFNSTSGLMVGVARPPQHGGSASASPQVLQKKSSVRKYLDMGFSDEEAIKMYQRDVAAEKGPQPLAGILKRPSEDDREAFAASAAGKGPAPVFAVNGGFSSAPQTPAKSVTLKIMPQVEVVQPHDSDEDSLPPPVGNFSTDTPEFAAGVKLFLEMGLPYNEAVAMYQEHLKAEAVQHSAVHSRPQQAMQHTARPVRLGESGGLASAGGSSNSLLGPRTPYGSQNQLVGAAGYPSSGYSPNPSQYSPPNTRFEAVSRPYDQPYVAPQRPTTPDLRGYEPQHSPPQQQQQQMPLRAAESFHQPYPQSPYVSQQRLVPQRPAAFEPQRATTPQRSLYETLPVPSVGSVGRTPSLYEQQTMTVQRSTTPTRYVEPPQPPPQTTPVLAAQQSALLQRQGSGMGLSSQYSPPPPPPPQHSYYSPQPPVVAEQRFTSPAHIRASNYGSKSVSYDFEDNVSVRSHTQSHHSYAPRYERVQEPAGPPLSYRQQQEREQHMPQRQQQWEQPAPQRSTSTGHRRVPSGGGGWSGDMHQQHQPISRSRSDDDYALHIGILVSQQESMYGCNMFDTVRPEDEREISMLMHERGCEREMALQIVFERKYDRGNGRRY